ncbi:hypothetical protein BDV96DRAFT_614534 [Lophiotrema nucula]|uniref:AB hydrolase-1 domain-containing protein n=1 Tax=Lophiotrema nucula TaxID=690887 RepID=A0A6A5YWR2_9PLEO|nr:hypothetical protein BDV96DRAFT_614534 [Lophiotrema nucula]
MGALEFLCDIRFHRSFVLPPNKETGRSKPVRISYADYGDRHSDAVVLFCGALMGTRFCYSPLDGLARAYNVRIIHPDRPGIGGSDPVELHERIPLWLEMVPHLLNHLNISRIAIASHSGGVIYALNTILTYPNLLHPISPYVAFFAPWVHHSHSGVRNLRATELLPAPLIGRFASMVRFINNNITPLAGLSSGFMHGIMESIHASTPEPAPVPLTPANTLSRTVSLTSRNSHQFLDLDDPNVVEELRRLITEYLFAEAIDGISDDAKLFLKKPSSIEWCSPSMFWSDIDYVVPLLSKMIDEKNREDGTARSWTINTFHAQTDNMVGEKGQQWFDECWKNPTSTPGLANPGSRNPTEEPRGSSFEYKSEVVYGSEHNYLMDPAYDAAEKWLWRVRDAFPTFEVR